MITGVLANIQAYLAPDTEVVAVAFKKDQTEAVLLMHDPSPERWSVGIYAEDGVSRQRGWSEVCRFGTTLEDLQKACLEYVRLSSAFVREYPSWYVPAPPYRSVPE